MTWTDPNADLEHTNETDFGPGGDCLTCGVKWPCPSIVCHCGRAKVAPGDFQCLTCEEADSLALIEAAAEEAS